MRREHGAIHVTQRARPSAPALGLVGKYFKLASNQLWWEYLCHGNQQTQQIKAFFFFFFFPENQFTSTPLWESRQIRGEKALELVFEKCERRNSGKERTSEVLENDATRNSSFQTAGNDWNSVITTSRISKTPFHSAVSRVGIH